LTYNSSDEEDQPVYYCNCSIYVDKSPPSQEEDEKTKMIFEKEVKKEDEHRMS